MPLRRTGNRTKDYVFRSFRMHPETFVAIEAIAVEESISVNSLCNAIFSMALESAQTNEGRAAIHHACTDWRKRYEYTETAKRQARLEDRGE